MKYSQAKPVCPTMSMNLFIANDKFLEDALVSIVSNRYQSSKLTAAVLLEGANTTHCKTVNNYNGKVEMSWNRYNKKGCRGFFFCQFTRNNREFQIELNPVHLYFKFYPAAGLIPIATPSVCNRFNDFFDTNQVYTGKSICEITQPSTYFLAGKYCRSYGMRIFRDDATIHNDLLQFTGVLNTQDGITSPFFYSGQSGSLCNAVSNNGAVSSVSQIPCSGVQNFFCEFINNNRKLFLNIKFIIINFSFIFSDDCVIGWTTVFFLGFLCLIHFQSVCHQTFFTPTRLFPLKRIQ